MSLSVIIPTYKNVEFLDELVSSIENSRYEYDLEVLIGIDYCFKTLDYVYQNSFSTKLQFFFFLENKGPYIIKNTLSKLAQHEKILFFDSDDIVLPNLFTEIDNQLDTFDLVKPKYMDFEDKEEERFYYNEKNTFGEGVFGIKKELFLSLNGFEGWKVAADSDLMSRLYKMRLKILHTNYVLFHRRLHPNSLTIHPETGLSSRLRSKYFSLSKNKKNSDLKLPELVTGEYKIVDVSNGELNKSFEELDREVELTEYEQKKSKHESIASLFSNEPKVPKTKEVIPINYERINKSNTMVTHPNLSSALKKAKMENIKKNYRR